MLEVGNVGTITIITSHITNEVNALLTQGALCSTVLGIGVWLAFINVPGWGELFPQQLAGVLAAVVGMVAGSLVPQWLRHVPGQHHAVVGVEQA